MSRSAKLDDVYGAQQLVCAAGADLLLVGINGFCECWAAAQSITTNKGAGSQGGNAGRRVFSNNSTQTITSTKCLAPAERERMGWRARVVVAGRGGEEETGCRLFGRSICPADKSKHAFA